MIETYRGLDSSEGSPHWNMIQTTLPIAPLLVGLAIVAAPPKALKDKGWQILKQPSLFLRLMRLKPVILSIGLFLEALIVLKDVSSWYQPDDRDQDWNTFMRFFACYCLVKWEIAIRKKGNQEAFGLARAIKYSSIWWR